MNLQEFSWQNRKSAVYYTQCKQGQLALNLVQKCPVSKGKESHVEYSSVSVLLCKNWRVRP